jgi:hypothetical protein
MSCAQTEQAVLDQPKRIQLRRTKGWRKPEGAIVVARPSRWGNPYHVVRTLRPPNREGGERGFSRTGDQLVVAHEHRRRGPSGFEWGVWPRTAEGQRAATEYAVELFRRSLEAIAAGLDGRLSMDYYLGQLRGHDLACWCPLDQPCHADVLLDLANAVGQR